MKIEFVMAVMKKQEEIKRVKELWKSDDFRLANKVMGLDTQSLYEDFLELKTNELIAEFELQGDRVKVNATRALLGFDYALRTLAENIK